MRAHFDRQPRRAGDQNLRPKKGLGQNFLVDPNMVGRIIDACHLSKEDTVLEIGPGTGALTRAIAFRAGQLTAVETDGSLVERLKTELTESHVRIVHADFLKVDLAQFGFTAKCKVIGNLPYYISTPIITKVLENRNFFTEFYLTVQLEFAQRVAALTGGGDYGSFSCFVQYYADVQTLFKIKRTSFKPAPKVDSCFLKLIMRPKPRWPAKDETFLFNMIRQAFQQRRKTLHNALSALLPKKELENVLILAGIDPRARAQEVSLERFVRLSHEFLAIMGPGHDQPDK